MNTDERGKKLNTSRHFIVWDTDKLSAAQPQPKSGHLSERVLLRVTGDPRNPPFAPLF
jgi:hypothetical protein